MRLTREAVTTYHRHSLDADTQAWVMSEEKFSEASQFDNEDGIMAEDEQTIHRECRVLRPQGRL